LEVGDSVEGDRPGEKGAGGVQVMGEEEAGSGIPNMAGIEKVQRGV